MNNPQVNQNFLLNPLLLKQDPGKQIKKMNLPDLKVEVSSSLFRERRDSSPPLKGQGFLSQRIKISRPEVRIVYFGTPDFSAQVLEKLIEFCQNSSSHPRGGILNQGEADPPTFTIQAVITQPDKPVGRKQVLTSSPVAQVAQKYNIPVLKPEKLDDDFIKNHLFLLDSDIFILVAFGKLLPQRLLDIPKFGALNIHPSLLPKYRGPTPIQNAILNGDKTSGVTIIKMDQEMDHGSIITTKEIKLSDKDTFATLSTKLFSAGANLLIKIIPDFVAGKAKLTPQNDKQASFTHLIKKEDGYFDLNTPPAPEQLDRMVRAYYPWPNVWTKWPFDSAQGKQARIVKFYPNGIVQIEGKKPVPLEDFLNGYPDFPIKNLQIKR